MVRGIEAGGVRVDQRHRERGRIKPEMTGRWMTGNPELLIFLSPFSCHARPQPCHRSAELRNRIAAKERTERKETISAFCFLISAFCVLLFHFLPSGPPTSARLFGFAGFAPGDCPGQEPDVTPATE